MHSSAGRTYGKLEATRRPAGRLLSLFLAPVWTVRRKAAAPPVALHRELHYIQREPEGVVDASVPDPPCPDNLCRRPAHPDRRPGAALVAATELPQRRQHGGPGGHRRTLRTARPARQYPARQRPARALHAALLRLYLLPRLLPADALDGDRSSGSPGGRSTGQGRTGSAHIRYRGS